MSTTVGAPEPERTAPSRWPTRGLISAVTATVAYATYAVCATAMDGPLIPRAINGVVVVLLMAALTLTGMSYIFARQNDRQLREIARLAGVVRSNGRRVDDLADRTVPIIYTQTPAPTRADVTVPQTTLTHRGMSRDDYWGVYADVLEDLAGVGLGDDPEGGVHPSVHL